MNRTSLTTVSALGIAICIMAGVAIVSSSPRTVLAQGVGRASWTPSTSTTQAIPSKLMLPGDSITYVTDAVWSRPQSAGLRTYVDGGLRYTHEVNDRGGRLSATGYWATNHPDPAFDRDDDDDDGRWEEAEITAGVETPRPGATYRTLVQFSRWHAKRQRGSCIWAWDRRLGTTEVLSQLSRDLFGEWQAERFTLTYDALAYPRVDARPELTEATPRARCHEPRPREAQSGVVVTFAKPLTWRTFEGLQTSGTGRWTAWEAIGSHPDDDLVWTCGGPNDPELSLAPCEAMGVSPTGITAAVGYFQDAAITRLREHESVARVDGLRDGVTSLLFDIGGFGVEPPDLTINDAYWELFLAD